ncbi:MAG: Re/Si-specific NAD(P)(+) transhydrogenase subunit alpha [Gomphosphaeria aponina SAG 52.96 = DSM 107014]|uniref:NAD(P) transhydrogenase subunit alpha n=1 Tax=Gomphosphaeria aponina SAG 52.96 = DSM 107014 TaxID=1521640 RepID=A0A941GNQ9_9CHRO|nr:Re/Si-specific NAD(P)(+) transhydrogenase subunit alpha [Gomphosphaeria aponina SAG 52.96 = DSM 107014]
MTIAIAKEMEVAEKSVTEQTLKIGVPTEIYPHECRVAATPDTVKKLQKLGFAVIMQAGAGEAANFPDDAYQQADCTIVPDAASLWAQADIVLKVRAPQPEEIDFIHEGQTLISFFWPAQNQELLEQLAARKATVLAMDSIPRISRAQKMDALSSMANIAGYRAVIEAANHFDRFFTGQITAAGKVPPAKVMVIGAGVAGLAAIGTARGLGAIVRAFDTRLVVKEQVESLGAHFLELHFEEDGSGEGGYAKTMSKEFIDAEMALFAQQAQEVDIIITTALIPGKPAPVLITEEMVNSMKEGSVIVDMAAEQGGNCAVTKPGEVYTYNGVTVIGYTDLPSRMASQSSQLYGTNLWHLLKDMGGNQDYKVNFADEVVRGALVLHEGEITWPAPKISNPSPQPQAQPQSAQAKEVKKSNRLGSLIWLLVTGVGLTVVGLGAPASFLSHLTVFVLACFVGWQLIWNVAPALHTPLMSVTNAISGIVIIGGMLQLSGNALSPTTILGAGAIMVASINIVGGFMVTQKMLNKFRK